MSSNSSSLDGANILVTGGTGSFGQAFISRLFAAHTVLRASEAYQAATEWHERKPPLAVTA